MTQAYNLAILANAVDTSGRLNVGTNATGTLPVANGGTGASSLTANNVLLGNGTSSVQAVAPSTNGNVLTSNGSTWVSQAPAGGGVTSLNGQTGAITNTGFNNIGSYSCGRGVAGTSYNVGTTVSGSSIAQVRDGNTGPFAPCQSDVGVLVGSNQGQTGTWRAMAASSAFTNEGTSFSSSTLWVRIS